MRQLRHIIEGTREACRESLKSEALSQVEAATKRLGVSGQQLLSLVHQVNYFPYSHEPIKTLKQNLAPLDVCLSDASIERFLLLHGAIAALDHVPQLPISRVVKRLICEEFIAFAHPQPRDIPMLQAGKASFSASCRVTSLRRFPAGQVHWEASGLPRSWLIKPKLQSLPRVWKFVALRLHGLKPTFSTHLAWRRKNRLFITEAEQNKSYYRIAQALALQPQMRGLVTDSWFYSPDTYQVSPHLAWLNRFFQENGGLVEVMGPAAPASGYLEGSAKRRRLYETGAFKPTTALVLWPRNAMLRWAARHPELAD